MTAPRIVQSLVASLALAGGAAAQGVPLGQSQTLFVLDLAGTQVGEFPAGVQVINGGMTVVDKDGQHMLRASSPSAFLITLPQALPRDFTLEFDIVPKAGGNPEDVAFEGTPTINQGTASANLLWHRETVIVIGGGEYYHAAMPEDLKASTPGTLTRVVAVFEGPQVKLYTNGRRLYTLDDRKFVRGRVLRVFLGGQDDGANAVHLAGLRIAAGTGGLGIIAAQAGNPPPSWSPSPPPAPQTPQATPPATSSPSQPTTQPSSPVSAPAAAAPVAPGTVAPGPTRFDAATLATKSWQGWGIRLTWDAVPNATGYRINRTVSGSGSPAVAVAVVGPFGTTATGYTAIDPAVLPDITYSYWAEAVMGPMGLLSAPSPISTANSNHMFQPYGLQSSVSATKLIVVRGRLATLGAIPGSDVTWTWQPIPYGFSYEISYEIVGGMPGLGPVFERATVPTSGYPPSLAPVTWGVPQGKTVKFCVSLFPDPDPAKLPPSAPCLTTQVP
jgi:hypothetical protein